MHIYPVVFSVGKTLLLTYVDASLPSLNEVQQQILFLTSAYTVPRCGAGVPRASGSHEGSGEGSDDPSSRHLVPDQLPSNSRATGQGAGERFEASGGSDGLERSSAAGHILTASV